MAFSYLEIQDRITLPDGTIVVGGRCSYSRCQGQHVPAGALSHPPDWTRDGKVNDGLMAKAGETMYMLELSHILQVVTNAQHNDVLMADAKEIMCLVELSHPLQLRPKMPKTMIS